MGVKVRERKPGDGKYIPTEDRTAANLLDGIKIRNLSATSGQEAEAAER